MQIESLKVFCDLAETESFTKSAQINKVTQSAVSQQISSLERQFKSLLIERSKKKFRLTREGQVLYDSTRKTLRIVTESGSFEYPQPIAESLVSRIMENVRKGCEMPSTRSKDQ